MEGPPTRRRWAGWPIPMFCGQGLVDETHQRWRQSVRGASVRVSMPLPLNGTRRQIDHVMQTYLSPAVYSSGEGGLPTLGGTQWRSFYHSEWVGRQQIRGILEADDIDRNASGEFSDLDTRSDDF